MAADVDGGKVEAGARGGTRRRYLPSIIHLVLFEPFGSSHSLILANSVEGQGCAFGTCG